MTLEIPDSIILGFATGILLVCLKDFINKYRNK